VFLKIFAIICFYSALLILLGASFVKIIQIVSVLGAIEIFNVLAIHPDDHVGITMPHDPRNPNGIFTAAQRIG
jgi:NADH:ubiquinone oxidoreductase subunit 6 (subunit J)